MDAEAATILQPTTGNSSNARPPIAALAILLIAATVLSLAVARLSVALQLSRFGAISLLPIICGLGIGVSLNFIAGVVGIRRRSIVLGFVVIASLATSAAEHGYFYLEHRRQSTEALDHNAQAPMVQLMAMHGPRLYPTFAEYMAAEAPAKWPLWTIDALTMIVISSLTAWLLMPTLTVKPQPPGKPGR